MLNLLRIDGELKVDGINERMKMVLGIEERLAEKKQELELNELEEGWMMLCYVIERGWKLVRNQPAMFRRELPYNSFMIMNLDDAYKHELDQELYQETLDS